MKRITIIGAGGPAGIGMTRCLTDHYQVSGTDTSLWAGLMMEAEATSFHLPDMYIPIPDSKVLEAAKVFDTERLFIPPLKQIETCQNKVKTAEMLGDVSPKTYWLRDSEGAGGKGAQMLSEYLPGKNFSQEFVFYKGNLLASFQKERISYLVKSREPLVTASGSSAVSICTDSDSVQMVAKAAMNTLQNETGILHGFYGVDLREDELGVPRVTEINAGRLLTASYSYFGLTGYNLPLIGVQKFLGDPGEDIPAYPVGFGIIRQVGQLPKLFPPEITKDWYVD